MNQDSLETIQGMLTNDHGKSSNLELLKDTVAAAIICRVCGKFDTDAVLLRCGHLMCRCHVGDKSKMRVCKNAHEHKNDVADGFERFRKALWENDSVCLGPFLLNESATVLDVTSEHGIEEEDDIDSQASRQEESSQNDEVEDEEKGDDDEENQDKSDEIPDENTCSKMLIPVQTIGVNDVPSFYCRQCEKYSPCQVDPKELNRYPMAEIGKIFGLYNLAFKAQTKCVECVEPNADADWCCIDCMEHLCHDHGAHHKNSKKCSDHIAVNCSMLKSALVQWILMTSEYCSLHPTEKYTHIDESGKKFCVQCPDKGNDSISISQFRKRFKNHKKESLSTIAKTATYCFDAQLKEKKNSLSRLHNLKEIQQEIRGFFHMLIGMLEEQQNGIMEEIQEEEKHKKDCFEKSFSDLNALLSELQSMKKVLNQLDVYPALQTSAITFLVNGRLNQIVNQVDERPITNTHSFNFEVNTKDWIDQILKINVQQTDPSLLVSRNFWK